MKDYGHLLETDERAEAFSAKVLDVHELLAEHEPRARAPPAALKVAYHDACHLAHAQKVRAQPRELLRGIPGLELRRARRVGAVLRLGRHLQPPPARGRRRARRRKAGNLPPPARRRSPPPTPAARCRSPRTWTARAVPIYHPMTLLDISIRGSRTVSARHRPDRTTTASPRSCPTTRSPSSASCTAASARAAPSCCRRAPSAAPPTGFLDETREIRDGDWQVPPPRADYADRRVEITGPTDRKLVINALNSGAKGFMADFEDANSPTWRNQVEGHVNLIDAIEGTITYDSSDGRHYELIDEPATLLVRPRGWHLPEKHLTIDGEPVAGALMDFGLLRVPLRAPAARQAAAASTSTCRRWSTTSRRALWNDVFDVHRGGARPADAGRSAPRC